MLKKETEVLLAWEGIYLVEFIDGIFWMFSPTPERDADNSLGWLELRRETYWYWDHNDVPHEHPIGRRAESADEAVREFLELHKALKEHE